MRKKPLKNQMAISEPTSNSYFVEELAKKARSDELAAPTDVAGLLAKLSYLTSKQVARVKTACKFAETAHAGQKRKTGHDYITHPLAVAGIVADLEGDCDSVIAAVLHDIIEDCDISEAEVRSVFGDAVAHIVASVSNLEEHSGKTHQADIIHRVLDFAAKEHRVILVKLADRLHNTRTLAVMEKKSRIRIATETLQIYAPIARRLGIYALANELEDLAFAAKHSFRHDHISHAIRKFEEDNAKTIQSVKNQVQAQLNEAGIDAKIEYYPLQLYTIYRRMKAQSRKFQDVMAFLNFCVLTKSAEDCYRVLGEVHKVFKHDQRGFRDYIASPKRNGYQGLHTIVIGPHGRPTKVQMRSLDMEKFALRGITTIAPYSYSSDQSYNESVLRSFRDDISDIQAQSESVGDFLNKITHDLNLEQILVYTPKNNVIHLPVGASVIDFAYKVSPHIGNSCIGCFVDGEAAPLSTVLESGQTINVSTAPEAVPNPAWLQYAKTPRARNAINAALDKQGSLDASRIGQALLGRALAQVGLSLQDLDFRSHRQLYKDINVRRRTELIEAIGRGHVSAQFVAMKLRSSVSDTAPAVYLEEGLTSVQMLDEHMNASYANCCGPVPGDQIMGLNTKQKGLVVHRRACRTAKSDKNVDKLPLTWGETGSSSFATGLQIWLTNETDSIWKLQTALYRADARLLRFEQLPLQEITQAVRVTIEVRNSDHLRRTIGNLRGTHYVSKVLRSGDKLPT